MAAPSGLLPCGKFPQTFKSIVEAFFNDPRGTIPLPHHDFHGGSAAMHARGSLVDPQTESDITDSRIGFKNPNGGGHKRVKVLIFPGSYLQSTEDLTRVTGKRAAFQEVEPVQPITTPERIETGIANRLFAMMGKRPDRLGTDVRGRMIEVAEILQVERREPCSCKAGQAFCQHHGIIQRLQ